MWYFAYGSNLDEEQMRTRCPGARADLRAVLSGYALVFTGHSRRWGGAVASVVRASDARVHGLLYEVSAEDLAALDEFEGHPWVYRRVEREVTGEDARPQRAHLYAVPRARLAVGAPSSAYLELIRRAYRRLEFDERLLADAEQPR